MDYKLGLFIAMKPILLGIYKIILLTKKGELIYAKIVL